MSSIVIFGITDTPARSDNVNNSYFFFLTLLQLSSEGVAVPKIIGIFNKWARITATSRAEYRNPDCCLKEMSCDSSMMITPHFLSGEKTAERVPMTMQDFTDLASIQVFNFFASLNPE